MNIPEKHKEKPDMHNGQGPSGGILSWAQNWLKWSWDRGYLQNRRNSITRSHYQLLKCLVLSGAGFNGVGDCVRRRDKRTVLAQENLPSSEQ